MIEKKTNKGSCYAVSGMLLMAHRLGVSANAQVTNTDITEELFEYEVTFKDAPIVDWSMNPNDMEAVYKNKQAVLFAVAMYNAATVGHELDKDLGAIEAKFFIDLLAEQYSQAAEVVSAFVEWRNIDNISNRDLYEYLQDVFTLITNDSKTRKMVIEITKLMLFYGGEITSTELREIVNTSVPFGILEYAPPVLYPTWRKALGEIL